MKRALFALTSAAVLLACHDEKTGVAVGPPLTVAPSASAEPPSALPWTSDAEPVVAKFVDLTTNAPAHVVLGLCEQVVVAVASGHARTEGEDLAPGDVLLVQGEGRVVVSGEGTSVLAAVRERPCDENKERKKHVLRAAGAPELTFMGGKMHAHLDVEKDVSPYAYVGRLSGSAAVPEHTHPGTWEVLCAIEASGTFTLAGQPKKLGPKTCVAVPPDTKHSWQPDEGSNLAAVQIYDPPGPEQRFKKLAAEAADAGK